MSRNDAMRDPFYAPILFAIERKLLEADRLAASRGIALTNSAIRSLLVRAINEAQGKTVTHHFRTRFAGLFGFSAQLHSLCRFPV